MPARTGQEYINGLKEHPREVWIDGERVEDVTTHPALRNGVKSVAALYDMQHDPELREEMTYASPTTGDPVGLSFMIPQTVEDLERRRNMMTRWAWASCGMMGRSPDFLNVIFAAWAGASDFFAQDRPEFKQNVSNYYEYIRENDLTLTHALLNLQRRRGASATDTVSEEVALTVVKETGAGVVLRGSRLLATLGPISDELAIYHAGNHRMDEEAQRQSFALSIPCDTPGLRFLCRESFDVGRSHFNHPLGSRFEEMDATIFFDDVLVPWDRVFLLGNVDMCNRIGSATQSQGHSGHQVLTRCLVKAEFILGLADLMVETLGSGTVPHVQEQVAELITQRDILKACLRASEADAAPNQWGVMSPATAPLQAGRAQFGRTMYPRMVEIIQLLGTSSLMALPSEADFDAPFAPQLNQYLATDTSNARDRTKLFHLAWDASCSSFSGRQVLYERMFGGNPLRNAMTLFNTYDKEPFRKQVRNFLDSED
ncbi:MAG TPA: 4-hydroxyphenylacetate 3-monooxygenase, oxygenase component [Dehalococcoidia bacterium]|nr:4-hydroxyphenylacetate 3-monooxygenase, oxygenase component [Dehalococcoidia bacterium]HAJ00497.1 4-hydroxyphenylacetate 3-monooxygenase, oxygenase component [Dehalococcoidia bacterium]|tara:strand:+ start:1368 stop:2822 length:1455 start_codon:yes stop_codon:yes gene_type:complete